MRVRTLNKKDFDNDCSRLGMLMQEGECPAAIVGVRTGGAVVAGKAHLYVLERCPSVRYFDVSASRASTVVKRKAGVAKFLVLMPDFVLDVLRVVEHYVRAFVARFKKEQQRNVRVDDALEKYLGGLSQGVVYIVDDAIDTGATLKLLLDEFRAINPGLDYRTAVLVVTQSKPLVSPDLSLYRNILLRFPWSIDFKQ